MEAPSSRIPLPQHSGCGLHGPGMPIPGNVYLQYEEPSPPDTIGSSNYTTDQFEAPPATRQRPSGPTVNAKGRGTALPRTVLPSLSDDPGMAGKAGSGANGSTLAPPAAEKAKRKRSGCLTCRDRHISCDEKFLPDCGNCRKSNRECVRGTRLNFHQIDVKDPPYLLPRAAEWSVSFKDESRAIASEYQDGLESYIGYDEQTPATPPEAADVISTSQPQRPRLDVQEALPAFNGSRNFRPQLRAQTGYFSGNSRPPHPEHTGYDESYGQPPDFMASSQRKTEAYLPISQQQPQPMPSQVMQGPRFGNSFPLSGLDERFPARDDGLGAGQSYRSSDVSSVTSSLVPIGAGPASHCFHPDIPAGGQQLPEIQEGIITPPSDKMTTAAGERDYLNDEEEIYYMQVFINEVAIWMDSFDHQKHFSRIVPFLALKSPMLLNAALACGIKHLTLTNQNYDEDKVLIYYDTATQQLLRSLQNPDRNMTECATTAAVLNVYEIMSESPQARMGHIAGARALIRECNWNAKSTGIGAACFWLNIGMEVLSCLAFNWQTAWDPDQWGLDVSFLSGESDRQSSEADAEQSEGHMRYAVGGSGEDEAWVHRIFYIVAKIANFRARVPRFQEPSPHDEQARVQSRFAEWKHLKAMSDRWNDHCPRPMRPFGYAPRRSGTSLFPNVWLIRRAAVVGRLFYHTAMCLLAQINPLNPRDSEENREAQLHHAHQVCGIIAHTKDHGVASVAIRSLTIASSVLTDRAEQKEVLAILDRIHKDTGWKLGAVLAELKKAWGWRDPSDTNSSRGGGAALPPLPSGLQQGGGVALQVAPMSLLPRPVHPLLARADFSLEDHPYRTWYRPPNGPSKATERGLWWP